MSLLGFENYFELFNLAPRFQIDRSALDSSYLTIQKQVHPDMHSSGTESEKRVAMQLSTLVNTAYRTLINPVQRASYLCQLHEVDPQIETNTSMPSDFLMQQMTWREKLDEIKDNQEEMKSLVSEVENAKEQYLHQLADQIDNLQDFHAAAQSLRALLFIEKFSDQLDENRN